MISPWHEGGLVAYDLETTAPSPEQARIVTVAYVDITPNPQTGAASASAYDVDRWSQLVNPGVDIPLEATEIHGITTDHAREHGRDPAEVVTELRDLLTAAWARGIPVIGHNVVYDLTCLDREMRRHLGEHLDITGPVLDTLCLDRALDKYRKGKRTLEAAASHYGCRLESAHDATEDALASARILWRMARRFPELAAQSLDDLQSYQAKHYAAWAENFEAYLRKQKRKDNEDQAAIDAVHIDRDWPLKPYRGDVDEQTQAA